MSRNCSAVVRLSWRSARSWPRCAASRTATWSWSAPSAGRSRSRRWSPSASSALEIEGQEVHTVGLPLHWGFEGLTKPGYLVNTLTPFVGDANIQTPEFKAFLVDVQKA